MARATALKVYVTPAGFYDAVVAAPSQKAALEAWGARSDLFGEKLACLETDEAWRTQALAKPGEVLRKPRGDAAALMAKPAPPRPPKPAKVAPPVRSAAAAEPPVAKPKPKPKPAPDRSELDVAEAALADVQGRMEVTRRDFARRKEELETEEEVQTSRLEREIRKAESQRSRAAAAFAKASD